MRKLLLKAKNTEERDQVKGKIDAREHMDWLVQSSRIEDKASEMKEYLLRADLFGKWTDELMETTDERLENRIIARVKEWERIKRQFLKDPHKFLKIWHP